jgi:uncharacterized protein (DUF1501 family)
MKRNRFLLGTVAGLTVAANTDSFFGRALAAAPLPGLPGGDGRVLVVINLQGGNDGLNTVVPHGLQQYYRYRPTLGIAPGDVLQLDATVGLNPALRSLKGMYDAGKVAIVQGVGYPKPDHSHFRSTEIWQTAAPDRIERTGWLGRYLDGANLPDANLFNAVAFSQVMPEAFLARKVDVPAIGAFRGYGLSSDKQASTKAAFASLLHDERVPFESPYLARVAEIEDHAQRGSEELPTLIGGYKTGVAYPGTPIARSLALAAQMIGSRLGTRVIYVQHGSFDTHAAQKGTQDRLLRELADALKAFYDDLAEHGNDARTLTMTFSEFGRRVAENASRGTDHGEASPMFIVGGGVRGGLFGEHPSLDALDNGDAVYTVDFRSVYATILEKWMGRPSREILAGDFGLVPMLA